MDDEVKVLQNLLLFLERCNMKGAEADAYAECRTYVVGKLNDISPSSESDTEETSGD
jgi:uncharacterized protein (DUF1919 family)